MDITFIIVNATHFRMNTSGALFNLKDRELGQLSLGPHTKQICQDGKGYVQITGMCAGTNTSRIGPERPDIEFFWSKELRWRWRGAITCFEDATGSPAKETQARSPNLLFLPDRHSQPLEGSAGLRIDHKSWWLTDWYVRRSAARSRWCPRIHVFGNARRSKAVTTNSFQDAACPRPFLNQLEDTPTIRRLDSIVSRFLPKEGKRGALGLEAK
jgi:hypothetical protein